MNHEKHRHTATRTQRKGEWQGEGGGSWIPDGHVENTT